MLLYAIASILLTREFKATAQEVNENKDSLNAAASSNKVAEANAAAGTYYKVIAYLCSRGQPTESRRKVRWTRVPDLVEKRKVFLQKGMAFVPQSEISSIVFQEFETRLVKALEVSSSKQCSLYSLAHHFSCLQMTAKALPRLDEDTRIIPILDNLSQGFLAGVSSEWGNTSSSGNGSEVTADMVDDIARKHYPACMRNLHDCLRRDRHLKHFGRLQYGLFLKVSLSV